MKEGKVKEQEKNVEHARKDLSDFSSSFSGSAKDLVCGIVEVLVRNRTFSYFCKKEGISYESMDGITKRKRGCSLLLFDDLLHSIGYELRLVKTD